MSRYIEVSPIPSDTTVSDLKAVFIAYRIERQVISGNKAFIEFEDINDIQTLDFAFDGGVVAQLDNAVIKPLPDDFEWPQTTKTESQPVKSKPIQKEEEQAEEKVGGNTFILDEKQEENINQSNNPVFVVIKNCDQDLVKELSKQYVKMRIFGKYKINRVFIWNHEVYVEFLNPLEVQSLESSFTGLNVPELGSKSVIDMVDESFNADIVEEKVREHQRTIKSKKIQDDNFQAERKAKQMEQIKKRVQKQEEQERNKSASKNQLQGLISKNYAAFEEQEQRKNESKNVIDGLIAKNYSGFGEQVNNNTWRLKPDTPLIPNKTTQGSNISIGAFWLLAIAVWASYTLFF